MARAGQGDFTARGPRSRPGRDWAVAIGLNDMLRRLQDFHEALQERVDEATAELRMRNEELVETYQRVFALREASRARAARGGRPDGGERCAPGRARR